MVYSAPSWSPASSRWLAARRLLRWAGTSSVTATRATAADVANAHIMSTASTVTGLISGRSSLVRPETTARRWRYTRTAESIRSTPVSRSTWAPARTSSVPRQPLRSWRAHTEGSAAPSVWPSRWTRSRPARASRPAPPAFRWQSIVLAGPGNVSRL